MYVCIGMLVCICMFVYVYMYACIYICAHVYTFVCVHMYVCMFATEHLSSTFKAETTVQHQLLVRCPCVCCYMTVYLCLLLLWVSVCKSPVLIASDVEEMTFLIFHVQPTSAPDKKSLRTSSI